MFPVATHKSVWTFGGLSWPYFVSGANYNLQGDCHLNTKRSLTSALDRKSGKKIHKK